MKIKSLGIFIILLFALVIMAFPFTANAVVNWTKTPGGNSVVLRGGTGSFDEYGLHRPVVINDGGTYKMWYTGINSGGLHSIGYATSSNGTSWAKVSQVFTKGDSGWDSAHVGYTSIIKETSGATPYKMWYSGTNDPLGQEYWQIGFAESADGITWTRYGSNPLSLKGSAGDWDQDLVGTPCVIKDGSTYKMWYFGANTSWGMGIGYATSTDGIAWTKYNNSATSSNPFANSDPVITLGNPGAWDGFAFFSPTVIKDGDVYRMWYDGSQADLTPTRIGYAFSYNGISWLKYDGNPVIMEGTAGTFDADGPFDAMVLKDSNTYRMYYAGSRDCTTDCIDEIGYAESYAYSGPNPVPNNVQVFTLNMSTGKQIFSGGMAGGPGPLDHSAINVQGPNGYSLSLGSGNFALYNIVGQQELGGFISGITDFASYAGTYTFTITVNNGATASRAINFTSPTEIPYPQDGVAGFQRQIEQGGTPYTTDNAYIGGTTPTFRWSPMTGYEDKYYRVRVWDLKRSRCWFQSTPISGTQATGGFVSATVPSGVLWSNAPYQYEIEVLDTNQVWSAHNRSRSTPLKFYTGTKGTDFISDSNVGVYHYKSFRRGDQSSFYVFVNNLAPWDIGTVPTPFQVTISGATPYTYNYQYGGPGYNDLNYYQPFPTDYENNSQLYSGAPTAGTYNFYISDGTNSDTASRTFADVSTVPQVTKATMVPADNTYVQTTEPTILSWQSFAGTGYKYRVRVNTWNNFIVWASSWIPGTGSADTMSVTVPASELKSGPYFWYVEVQDTGNNTRTRSQYLTLNLVGSAGGSDYIMEAWGTGNSKLAAAFNNYSSGNGIYSNNGVSWSKLTDWVPDGMGAWGDGNLGALFTNYGSGNGLWSYNGTTWTKLTDWILDDGEAWGGTNFAASFTNYGDGNGIWNYNGSAWTKITNWIPSEICPWGGTHLATVFSNYDSGNGIWSYDGASWTKLTDWIPEDIVAYGTDKLIAQFTNYGTGNGMWSYNGSAWTKLTDWIPAWRGVSWGTNSFAVFFTNYDTGNGLWSYNGTNWEMLTGWVPDGTIAVGTTTLGAAFSNYGTGNGLWSYNGSWTKITDWIPDDGRSWGTGAFAGIFTNYSPNNGILNYTGSWTNLTSWIPAQQPN